jgi:peptide/nickel transport system substrate-binding protein
MTSTRSGVPTVRTLAQSVVAVLLTGILAAGCGSKPASQPAQSPQSPAQAKKTDLVIGIAKDTDNFDFFKTSWTTNAMYQSTSRLVEYDMNMQYIPGIAERWETSADGLTWTFYLKKGVKFHDGTPVTSKAVKFYFDTVLDKETASPSATDYVFARQVQTPDDYTIVLKLEKPYPNLLFKMASNYTAIVPPEAYLKYGPKGDQSWGSKNFIGSGPFKLKEWVPNSKTVLERNPDFAWAPKTAKNQGASPIQTITYKVIPDAATQVAELRAGGIDMLLDVPVEQVAQVKQIPNVQVLEKPAFGIGYLGMATDKAPLNNVKLRQAINHALNREGLVKTVFMGVGTPAYGYLPPLVPENLEDKEAHKYDVALAKKLVQESGVATPIKLTLSTDNKTSHVRMAEAIQAQLKEIGIEANVEQMDNAAYVSYLKAGKQDLFVREYTWNSADILQWFLDKANFPYPNHSRWQDEKTSQLMIDAETAPNLEARAQKYKEVQRLLIDQAVWAPIWYPQRVEAVRTDRVQGYVMHPSVVQLYDVTLK